MQLKAAAVLAMGTIISTPLLAEESSGLKGWGVRVEGLITERTITSDFAAQDPKFQTSTDHGARDDNLLFLANGQLVSWPVSISCKIKGSFTQVAILYNPAKGEFAGDITCDGDKQGTELDWFANSAISVHFTSRARRVGDELQLDGKLELRKTSDHYQNDAIGESSIQGNTVREIVQSAVFKIAEGKSCEIRKMTLRDEEIADSVVKTVLHSGGGGNALPMHHTDLHTYSAGAQTICKLM